MTEGIIRAHREGIVTSTTLMTNRPGAGQAAALALENPRLGVGVHLNLTAGQPVLPPESVPSLVGRDGRFRKDYWRLRFQADREAIRREWRAQIQRFLEFGLTPTHLDSHHYSHLVPDLFHIACQLAEEFGIPAIRTIPGSDWPLGATQMVLRPMDAIYRRYLRKTRDMVAGRPLQTPDRVIGLLPPGRQLTIETIINWLDGLESGVTEYIGHPGWVDEELMEITSLREGREHELALLCHPVVREAVKSNGIELISFAIFSNK